MSKKKIKILRIITRLNIGGPAIHVNLLTSGLDPERFDSVLVSGNVSDLEGDMSYVSDELKVRPLILTSIRREINFVQDAKSLFYIFRLLVREKPDIVDTHTAKAGTLGRIAVFIHNMLCQRRIRVVHTFHGHVFHGYFNYVKSRSFVLAERCLAKATDVIIAISPSQQAELSGKYRIAPKEKFQTVKLGFDLQSFLAVGNLNGQFRKRLGVDTKVALIGIVGRLVTIKNHKMFLNAAKLFATENPGIKAKFVIIGDGELRRELTTYCINNGLSDFVIFCGWIKNLPLVYAALDVLVLTSINEGTPVSIIEAMASSVPVISTDAGGVRDLIAMPQVKAGFESFEICDRGLICRQEDVDGLAKGIKFLLTDNAYREKAVAAARAFVQREYGIKRLLDETASIYLNLSNGKCREQVVSEIPANHPIKRKRTLRVLQVYKDYYPPVIGGVEGHINLLANGLKARGIKVEALVSNTSASLEIDDIDGIRVIRVPQWGRFASAPLNVGLAIWLRRLGREADIIHFHFPNPTGEIASLFSGLEKKIVVTYHSDIIRQANLAKLYAPFLEVFLKNSRTIIATSPAYVRSSGVLRRFQEKCTVIPFGIDLTRFELNERRIKKVAGIRETHGGALILFVGRFRYYKGLYILIEAMKAIEGTLLLVGIGPMETELKKRVAADNQLKEKVFFLGELSNEDVVNHLHACDVFVLPSIFRSEAFGIVLLEAMACAKPLITTELGTGTSFVNQHQETGLVVPPHNVEALAAAVNYLLTHGEVRERFGKAARERAEEYFCLDRMVEDIIRVYQDVQDQRNA